MVQALISEDQAARLADLGGVGERCSCRTVSGRAVGAVMALLPLPLWER